MVSEMNGEELQVNSAPGLHAGSIIPALQQGKNVLVQSPLCLTSAAAWQIAETAKFTRKEVAIQAYFGEEILAPEKQFQKIEVVVASDEGSRYPEGGLLYLFPAPLELLSTIFLFVDVLESRIEVKGEEIEEAGWCKFDVGGREIELEWKKGASNSIRLIPEKGDSINPIQEELSRIGLMHALKTVTLIEKVYKTSGITF